MHVLTKIFVVLVSLLAVMLVPLVVVYTANEDSYQKLHQQAQDRALAARSALTKAEEGFGIQVAQKDDEIEGLTDKVVELQKDLGKRQVEIRRLETSVAENEVVLTLPSSWLAGRVARSWFVIAVLVVYGINGLWFWVQLLRAAWAVMRVRDGSFNVTPAEAVVALLSGGSAIRPRVGRSRLPLPGPR